jgi:hypothetical protein
MPGSLDLAVDRIASFVEGVGFKPYNTQTWPAVKAEMALAIDSAINAAVAEEREACAKLADIETETLASNIDCEGYCSRSQSASRIAASIRARQ